MVGSRQWRTERAEEAIRPGRHFETGGKKGEKEKKEKKEKGKKEKGRKREKENMEEACNYSKTKHLICGALTHNLACWRPCPFWGKRVVTVLWDFYLRGDTCFCVRR